MKDIISVLSAFWEIDWQEARWDIFKMIKTVTYFCENKKSFDRFVERELILRHSLK